MYKFNNMKEHKWEEDTGCRRLYSSFTGALLRYSRQGQSIVPKHIKTKRN